MDRLPLLVLSDFKKPMLNGLKRILIKSQHRLKKASQRELDEYGAALLQLPNAFRTNGKLSAQVINAYNKKMAELMSQKTSDIRAPSGRVVSFVAKRGEIGVFMALSNYGYDPTQYRQGVYGDGRIAYRKTHANKINI